MSLDVEIRELERRVLSGDREALPRLRVAWWRAGPPVTSGKTVRRSVVIDDVPRPDDDVKNVGLSPQALKIIGRALTRCFDHGHYSIRKLRDVSYLTVGDLLYEKGCGPKRLEESLSTLERAGLKARDA